MSIFDKFRKTNISQRKSDEEIYSIIAQEMEEGIRHNGLWLKALVLADGNTERQLAHYIKLRAQAIRDDIVILTNLSKSISLDHRITGGLAEKSLPNTSRYEILGVDGGIICDIETGLEWMRCSLGQTWNSATQRCTGTASPYAFDEALDAAIQLNNAGGYGGYSDWRVPRIEELRTLVYCSSGQPTYFKNNNLICLGNYSRPTIVEAAFPDTPRSSFWSGSPVASHSNGAWYVGFGDGHADSYSRSGNGGRVRLVRGGQ